MRPSVWPDLPSADRSRDRPVEAHRLAGARRPARSRGWSAKRGAPSGGKGPTAVLYELNPRAGWVVGIDVGRDWVRAAIADVTGEFVARRDERARVKSARTLITADRCDRARPGRRRGHPVAAGDVRDRREPGRARARPRSGRPRLQPARVGAVRDSSRRAAELGTKTAFENDVNLAALGEQWHGSARGVENFVYLHLGTGVGMGLDPGR